MRPEYTQHFLWEKFNLTIIGKNDENKKPTAINAVISPGDSCHRSIYFDVDFSSHPEFGIVSLVSMTIKFGCAASKPNGQLIKLGKCA